MNKKVVIIDYNLGNLFSVQQAFLHFGINADITEDKRELEKADAVVLPGVGAFAEAMKNLNSKDLVIPILDFIQTGKPFMGICLGQQLLFDESEEFGSAKGLGVIKGTIKKFDFKDAPQKVPVPQISWNQLHKKRDWESTPFSDLKEGDYMYFVHSFYVRPDSENVILSTTNYEGLDYCSAVLKNNVFATQFHPEKSADKGLSIYKNWISKI